MVGSLSIVFVNYNSAALILGCIDSIYCYDHPKSLEILIVDNRSNEGEQDKILQKYPFVKWIQMDYNAGYARANNKGIKLASNEIILLLNPDVLFKDNSLQECYEVFASSEYSASCVQLLNPDESPQISGGYFIKGGLNNLLPLPVLGKVFKWLGELLQIKQTSLKNADDTREVDWINGAFMMVKKNVIERSGLLDEDFFLYSEEIEWCSRIRKFGKLCVYGKLHAIHLQGETANNVFQSLEKGYYNLYDRQGRQILVSNFIRIRKQFGIGWFLFHMICYFIEIPFFFLLVLFRTILFFKKGFSFIKFWGYISNLFYLLYISGKIIKNKPYFYKVI